MAQAALAPRLIKALADRPEQQRIVLLNLILPILGDVTPPDAKDNQRDLRLKFFGLDNASLKACVLALLKDLMLLVNAPCQPTKPKDGTTLLPPPPPGAAAAAAASRTSRTAHTARV